MGGSNSGSTNKPRDSKQLHFPDCWKWWEFIARTFMAQALTASLFSPFSASHWRLLCLTVCTQDHCSRHHDRCVHCERGNHCGRSRSKRGKGPFWGQSCHKYSRAHRPWDASDTEAFLWGHQEESHWLAPNPHREHCGEALPERDQR